MFVAARVAQALEGKRAAFRQALEDAADESARYSEAIGQLTALSAAEIGKRLGDEEWPGARPTAEWDRHGLALSFPHRWENWQEARGWAMERLASVPTVAVDGSQILASKEFAVPVSLVQVAWFENYHRSDGQYVKDVRDEIVTSSEALDESEEFVAGASRLNQRRFALEMETAIERLEQLPTEPVPVVLLDGSLVLSFVGRLIPPVQQAYLKPLFGLLEAAQARRIPVVGYVDRSYARDLTQMLGRLFGLPEGTAFDTRILAPYLEWFDRTPAWECARGDVLPQYREHQHDLFFTYLKTGEDRLPARLDFARWVLEEGLLDHVVDVIRGEIVVGTGYPYAIETADATAVLTAEDRMAFYRLYGQFAESSGLRASLPTKSVSKLHRR